MTTATTPSSFSAWLVSMLMIRACGYGECRILPMSMPGRLRSSVYFPLPVVFSAASTIAVGLPIMENPLFIYLLAATPFRLVVPSDAWNLLSADSVSSPDGIHPFTFRLDRRPNGFIHLVVSGAAAQIAAERRANVGFRGIWVLGKQRLHRHNEAGGTVAALRSTPVAISFLDCGKAAMFADSFDRGDLLPFATSCQQRTRHHGNPIDE